MSYALERIKKLIALIEEKNPSLEALAERLENKRVEKSGAAIPIDDPYSETGRDDRINFLRKTLNISPDYLTGNRIFEDLQKLEGNIENYIGMTMVPTGIIGPLHVKGIYASGNYFIPLATTEGALVASYNRGARACTMSGGVTSVFMAEGVQRSPLFRFSNIPEAGKFTFWVAEHVNMFKKITSETSRYATLENFDARIQGNEVILTLEYATGDAAGQNMVTICTQAICEYIVHHSPVQPEVWYIEGNYSGDKKANAVSFSRVRGKKVTAEVVIPKSIVKKVLKSKPKYIAAYWQASTIAVLQTGSIGAQGHFANGLTALFMACGQDVACVSEAAVGVTRMEVNPSGDLYATVTLPNLIVGTVGGGTHLPTQAECLGMMDCLGPGKARKFAEICAAMLLAGELSLAAALSIGHFTKAHQKLGRKK